MDDAKIHSAINEAYETKLKTGIPFDIAMDDNFNTAKKLEKCHELRLYKCDLQKNGIVSLLDKIMKIKNQVLI